MPHPDQSDRGATLVTGGTGAIGAAVTRLMCAEGNRVVFTYRNGKDRAQELSAEIARAGGDATAVHLDLTDPDAAARTVAAVDSDHGGLRGLVYASGPFVELTYLSKITPQQYAAQISADAVAFFNVLQPAIEPLRRTRGSVVAVATAALKRAIIRDGLSAGPKGAVEGLIRTLALEEGRFGIRANCVGVGMTSVGMAAELIEAGSFGQKGVDQANANIPLRRFGNAEEVAEAVNFLASDRASFITGQLLHVDGGYTA